MLDSGGYIETFDGFNAALSPSATLDRVLAISSASINISGLALRLALSDDTVLALTALADGAADVAATDAAASTLGGAVDMVTAPSAVSLLYAPLAAGAACCCFGWLATRFKRRPIRSSAQNPDGASEPGLDLIALRAARHNPSDSIAA
jgi:hypothetical protein